MKTRIRLWTVVLLLLAALIGGFWLAFRTGLDGVRLEDTIRSESSHIQARLDDRFDRLERKVDDLESQVERRLDRLEARIDRLIELATPRLPDGMEFAP